MFPPLSHLFLLFGLLFHLPFGVFPLPLLALEKGLYLREQDTGLMPFRYMLHAAHKGNTSLLWAAVPIPQLYSLAFGFIIGRGTIKTL